MGKHLRGEFGQNLIVFALMLPVLLGAVGLVTDAGMAYIKRLSAQNAADAAALAGAIAECSASNATTAAEAYALSNGAVVTNHAYTLTNGYVVTNTVSILSGDANFAHYVQVVVHDVYKPTFASLLWKGTLNVTGTARAGCKSAPLGSPVIVLDPTDCQSFYISGSSNGFTVNNGTLQVNSSCSTGNGALYVYGSSNNVDTATPAQVVGTAVESGSSNNFNFAPQDYSKAEADPLADLEPPSYYSTNYAACPTYSTSYYGGSSQTYKFSPGIYTNGLYLAGSSNTFIFQQGSGQCQGWYIIRKATSGSYQTCGDGANVGLCATGSSLTLSGSNVFFYLDSGAGLDIHGSSISVNLSPPTSGSYAGILFFQARSNSQTAYLSGSSGSLISGVIYLPNGMLEMQGSSNSSNLVFDVYKLYMYGSSLSWTVNGYSGTGWVKTAAELTY